MKKKVIQKYVFFKNLWSKLWRLFYKSIIVFLIVSITPVIIYKYKNPPITPLMIIRALEKRIEGKPMKITYKWVSLNKISKNLITAAVTSEDNLFLEHSGFDLEAIRKAYENNQKHNKRIKGGSTISQQTAKNVFLWTQRSWIRKGLETYFTFLIELFWSKERIMEVYLNVIEMGDGIYGAESASQFYFKKPASKLSKEESAAIIVILPNPLKYSVNKASPYINKRKNIILKRMAEIGDVKFN
jgi:monofunctional biosynthetic peptidoglycan transglycosylase